MVLVEGNIIGEIWEDEGIPTDMRIQKIIQKGKRITLERRRRRNTSYLQHNGTHM